MRPDPSHSSTSSHAARPATGRRRRRTQWGGAAVATGVALATTAASLPPAAATSAAAPAAPAAPAAAVPGYTLTSADQRMRSALTSRATTARFGSTWGGSVIDASSNTVIWSKRGTTSYIPASNAKLFTAAAALTQLGPSKTFTSYVRQGSTRYRVVLVGAGDPLLTSSTLNAMARTTAADLKRRGLNAARVYVDDNYFPAPSLAPGWKSSYVPSSATPVRPLVRDNKDLMDTSKDAGGYFRSRLEAYGIARAIYVGRADAPTSARTIASARSVSVASMVDRMLLTSDNDVAEILLRKTSASAGNGRTWTGARTTQSQLAGRQRLGLGGLYDGSGLSRSNRVSPYQLTQLVRRGLDTRHSELYPLRSASAVPTAGRTGTLASRFTTSASRCAVGKVWAKTGTLGDVVALTGWTKGRDGRVKVFSFLVNGKSSTTALKQNVDMLAATVNGCY